VSIDVKQVGPEAWRYAIYFRWPSKRQCRERQRIPQPLLTKRKAQEWAEERYRSILAMGEAAYEDTKKGKKANEEAARSTDALATFKSFAPRWVNEMLLVEDYSDGTRAEYQRLLESDVYPLFEDLPLKSLRRDHIQRLKGDYLSEDYAKSTINNVLSIISGILKYAVEVEVLPGMPCTITQLTLDDAEMQRYSDEEYDKLITAAEQLGPATSSWSCSAATPGCGWGRSWLWSGVISTPPRRS
jgi:hypothetical protein